MASIEKIELVNETGLTANVNGSKKALAGRWSNWLFHTKVSNHVTGTFTVTIEHSPDNGTTWFTLASVAALAGDGSELDVPSTDVLGTIRAVVVTGGGPNADVLVEAIYDPSKG